MSSSDPARDVNRPSRKTIVAEDERETDASPDWGIYIPLQVAKRRNGLGVQRQRKPQSSGWRSIPAKQGETWSRIRRSGPVETLNQHHTVNSHLLSHSPTGVQNTRLSLLSCPIGKPSQAVGQNVSPVFSQLVHGQCQ